MTCRCGLEYEAFLYYFVDKLQAISHQESCSCEEIKAEIKGSMSSPILERQNPWWKSEGQRREAVSEKNETERKMATESVKVMKDEVNW